MEERSVGRMGDQIVLPRASCNRSHFVQSKSSFNGDTRHLERSYSRKTRAIKSSQGLPS